MFAPHPQLSVRPGRRHEQESLAVRPLDRRADAAEHGKRRCCRVPVAVVAADGNQPDPRLEGSIETFALVGRTVVGHFDDVDRTDRARGEERILRLFAEVAQEDRREPPAVDGDGDASRIPGERRLPRGGTRRPDHPPVQRSETPGDARVDLGDAGTAPPETGDHLLVERSIGLSDQRFGRAADECLESADMVGVVVREHEEVDPGDPEPVEARCSGPGPSSDIDHEHGIPVADQHPVALADVAGGDLPIGRKRREPPDGGSAENSGVGDEAHDERASGRRRDPASASAGRQDEKEDREQHGGARDDSARALDPRKRAPRQSLHASGERRDPLRRSPGDPDDHLPECGDDGEEQAGEAAEDGGDRGGGRGQEIGGNPVQRQCRAEEDEHRLTRQLRGDRDRQGQRQRARQPPAECAGERCGEDEKAGRSEDREHEAVVACDPRVDDHHHDHGESQSRQALCRPAAGDSDQDDGRHDGGPHHAGAGRDENHERTERHERAGHACTPTEPDAAEGEEHEGGDERAVRSGHRGEVRQRARLHRVAQPGVHGRLVADRQPGEERAAVTRCRRGRLREALPDTRGPRRPGRWPGRRREPLRGPQCERRRVPRFVGLDAPRPLPTLPTGSSRASLSDSGATTVTGAPAPGPSTTVPRETPLRVPIQARAKAMRGTIDAHGEVHFRVLASRGDEADRRTLRRIRGDGGEGERSGSKHDARQTGPAPDRRRSSGCDHQRHQRERPRDRNEARCGLRPGDRHRGGDPEGRGRQDESQIDHQTVTLSLMPSKSFCPMPVTFIRSSTALKRPLALRQSRIRWASAGPIRGSVSRSACVAVLSATFGPVAPPAPPVDAGGPPAAPP